MKTIQMMLYLLLTIIGMTIVTAQDQFFDEFINEEEHVHVKGEVEGSVVGSQKNSFEAYEDDEFINTPDKPQELNNEESWLPGNIDIDVKAIEEQKILNERDYYVEVFYVSVLILYCVVFIFGKISNDRIKANWEMQFLESVREQFVDVGAFKTERLNQWSLVATGREYCEGFQAVLELQSRQDLLSILLGIFQKVDDKLVIDIALKNTEDFVFALVASHKAVAYKNEMKDLEHFTSTKSVSSLSQHYVVLAESETLVSSLLTKKITSMLNAYDDFIEIIHITDTNPLDKIYERSLRIVMKLPTTDLMEGILDLVFSLVDTVGKTTFHPKVKSAIIKQRAKVASNIKKNASDEDKEEKQRRIEERKAKKEEGLTEKQLEALQKKREAKRLKKRQQVKFKVV